MSTTFIYLETRSVRALAKKSCQKLLANPALLQCSLLELEGDPSCLVSGARNFCYELGVLVELDDVEQLRDWLQVADQLMLARADYRHRIAKPESNRRLYSSCDDPPGYDIYVLRI
jgi:hypothetical protein